jgi:hypothetical protein
MPKKLAKEMSRKAVRWKSRTLQQSVDLRIRSASTGRLANSLLAQNASTGRAGKVAEVMSMMMPAVL